MKKQNKTPRGSLFMAVPVAAAVLSRESLTKYFWRALTAIALCVFSLFGIFRHPETTQTVTGNGSLAGVDALGRQTVSAGKSEKQVGLFYFLWLGQHSSSPPLCDNTKLVAAHPEAVQSEEAWMAAGGLGLWDFHHWGEPLFGYYTSSDAWVYRKHCQMLTDAGVDFLVFDTTNASIYENAVRTLISVWYEYLEAGWDVPKLAFYTNTKSGETMNRIYDAYYNNAELRALYPRLDELWYRWCDSDRPMIVGDVNDAEIRPEVREFFRIKQSQWPNAEKQSDGFPWMEFDDKLTLKTLYGKRGHGSVMSVSLAQHNDTVLMSATAWYGKNDSTRAWHSGKSIFKEGGNDPDPAALLGGANAAEQWAFARKMDPDVIFVTGFNEWVAQRLSPQPDYPIAFCDCADTLCSRDLEPSAGVLGDNYYMQTVDEIRKFKHSVDVKASGAAEYRDYEGDTAPRDSVGFGGIEYRDDSGRNDIVRVTVARDGGNLIFTAETRAPLTPESDQNWMTLFIRTGGGAGWEGYDYVIGRESPGAVERSAGGWAWTSAGQAQWAADGKRLTLTVPRALLGNPESLQFKWADNYTPGDVYSFYTRGDAAPLGRLNYCWRDAQG